MVENIKLNVADLFMRLAETLASYEDRPQQHELALSIERVFSQKRNGIFEAGTGTGKSLAALIPAALSGKRVVVSTNTISLQEQYINKDIPTLKKVLPFDIDVALLKGRGNYIGMRRWEDHLLEQAVDERLIEWVQNSDSGDISELDFVPGYDTWFEINSSSDDCLRAKCPHYNDCFYFSARRFADKADILVVNHALLVADAASHGNILPAYDLLIVDEAHHFPDVATNAFSLSINKRGLRATGTRAIKRAGAPAGLITDIECEAHIFFNQLLDRCPGPRSRLREPVDAQQLINAIEALKLWLEEETFAHLIDVDMAQEKARLKAKAVVSILNGYLGCLSLVSYPDPAWVLWVERDVLYDRVEVTAAPLDVSSYIRNYILEREGLEASVWMSATLATGGPDPFSYFKRTIGVDTTDVIQQRIASPFDYPNQGLLYLPKHLPEPNHKSFVQFAAHEIDRILTLSEGRAFVLFTSKSALNSSYDLLAPQLAWPTKRQGEMSRKKLIQWFVDTPHAVLFGTSSFWEGVSIDGEKLSCVIIDRIPFQVPDDPVYEARCELLKADPDASWFNDLALPHATMRLKQGVGRLIRTHIDRGIVAILDNRLTSKYYGKRILECLPPMRIVRTLEEVEQLVKFFVAPPVVLGKNKDVQWDGVVSEIDNPFAPANFYKV